MTYKNIFALKRFTLKCAMIIIFATIQWHWGFVRALALLSGFSALIAVGFAAFSQESLRESYFTYWDEAGAFLFINTIMVIILIEV